MTPEAYLNYLIESCEAHARGDTSIGVQPSELKTLKALMQSEQARLTLAVNKNGNPA
jgi:hypothetical protein